MAILFTSCLCFFAFNQAQAEQNSNVIISLDAEKSIYAAYGECFTYTNNTSLYVAINNKVISLLNAFDGTCEKIAISENEITLLVKKNGTISLKLFSFDEEKIEDISSQLVMSNYKPHSIFTDENGALCIVAKINENNFVIKKLEDKTYSNNDTVSSWVVQPPISGRSTTKYTYIKSDANRFVFAIEDNKLYSGEGSDFIVFNEITTIPSPSSFTVINEILYVNAEDGIYTYNPKTLETKKIATTPNKLGSIQATSTDVGDFMYINSQNAIIQYKILDNGLEYYNKFNDAVYAHPTSFDIVKVALIKQDANVYASPRNLQINSKVNANDYVLVLTQAQSDVSLDTFYYIVKEDGLQGYIKSNVELTYIDPNANPSTMTIGLFAQGLHPYTDNEDPHADPFTPNTIIYKYPYASSEELIKVSISDQLVIINNVAEVDGNQIWQYYKVSFVKNEEIYTGYVKAYDISPYTSLKPPKVLKSVTIKTDAIGETVTLYALPSEDSTVISSLVDGAELDLAEEFNPDSKWTKVIYNNGYAYVLTSSIQTSGLTALQITLIVISIIVVITTIVMVIILVKKHRSSY